MIKVRIAKNAGFCFGVKRALKIAHDAAVNSPGRTFMLGDIVHNEIVVRDLRNSGIRKIRFLGKGCGNILLIRAHGAEAKIFSRARKAGYKIIDATCPMVKEIHEIVKKFEEEGRTVIIIGDREHDEVRGILGQLRHKAIIINSRSDVSGKFSGNIEKAGVVVQSTQDEKDVLGIVGLLKKHCADLIFKNTICNPTRTKQGESRRLPVENDIVIVVGSRTSANTKRLYEISRRLNRRTYWINSPDELKSSWLKGARSVGITAGASTPDESINMVARAIRAYGRTD